MKKLIILLCVAAAGCQAPVADQSITEKDRAAISALEETYMESLLNQDEAGLRTVFAEDAITMPPNASALVGIEAIIADNKSGPRITAASTEFEEVEGTGGLAYARGTFNVVVQLNDTTELPVTGKFIEVWKKEADGSWKISRDIWNANQAPQ